MVNERKTVDKCHGESLCRELGLNSVIKLKRSDIEQISKSKPGSSSILINRQNCRITHRAVVVAKMLIEKGVVE